MKNIENIKNLVEKASERKVRISDIALEIQADHDRCGEKEVYGRMASRYRVMEEAVAKGIETDRKTVTGLSGGDAAKLSRYIAAGRALAEGLPAAVARNAVAVSEVNAGMGRIVACPTAGSCGILPGLLTALEEKLKCERKEIIMSLFTAGAFGAVTAAKATVSGAEGGCQAECGTAAAMAAAAGCELLGGTPGQCAHAFAIALVNSLGLVCDPVGGYVEYPCVLRNASGAVSALAAAEMALAGVESVVPADEVILAMKDVGTRMDSALKETALGGLAATPTAVRLCGGGNPAGEKQ